MIKVTSKFQYLFDTLAGKFFDGSLLRIRQRMRKIEHPQPGHRHAPWWRLVLSFVAFFDVLRSSRLFCNKDFLEKKKICSRVAER